MRTVPPYYSSTTVYLVLVILDHAILMIYCELLIDKSFPSG